MKPKIPPDWQWVASGDPRWRGDYFCRACGKVALDVDWDCMGLGWTIVEKRFVYLLACNFCGSVCEPAQVIEVDLPLFAGRTERG